MKKFGLKSSLAAIGILLMALLLLGSCNKKEAPAAPTNLKVVLNGDCIHLSWNKVPHADYYRITVGFHIRNQNNELGEIYEIFLCETSDHTYNDRYPFEKMNYYKIEAVNEYGSSPCSEVSCDYPYNGGSLISLYPNPTMGYVSIEAKDMNHITVTDLHNEVLLEWEVAFDHCILDMSQLNPGIYLMHVYSEEGEAVKRFVIN